MEMGSGSGSETHTRMLVYIKYKNDIKLLRRIWGPMILFCN